MTTLVVGVIWNFVFFRTIVMPFLIAIIVKIILYYKFKEGIAVIDLVFLVVRDEIGYFFQLLAHIHICAHSLKQE